MRRMIMIVLLFGLAASQAVANPLPAYDIQYIKAYPPQIRLNSNGFLTNLSGVMIFTRSSTAVIDSGVYIYEMPLTLDSTNTSGFTLDTEADSIMVDLPGAAPAKWGTLNHDTPPIKGYGIYKAGYSPTGIPGMGGWYLLLFDFAVAKMGFTQIIINEINAHNNWQNGCNFIELCNKDQVNHDISNWMIVCDTIYRIPTGTIIPSHGYFVLDESNFPALFDLDFGSDNIYLINADSQLVDEVGWSSDHGLNISFIRYPDGDADSTYNMIDFIGYNDNTSTSFENGFPTRGAFNRHESPGFKVIGIRADTSGGLANFHWTNPAWDTLFSEAILRKSTSGFPMTPYDGDIVYEGSGQEFIGDTLVPGVTNYYVIYARTRCGQYSTPDSEAMLSIFYPSTGIDEVPTPDKTFLLECYPNPFNSSTLIRYSLPEPGIARLAIYNISGQRVAILCDSYQQAGEHNIVWNGKGVSSGIYFARLESRHNIQSIKLTLLK